MTAIIAVTPESVREWLSLARDTKVTLTFESPDEARRVRGRIYDARRKELLTFEDITVSWNDCTLVLERVSPVIAKVEVQ